MHPQVSTVGEFGKPIDVTSYVCSCGAPLRECAFYAAWGERARRQGIDFRLGDFAVDLEPTRAGGLVESAFYYHFPWRTLDRIRDVFYSRKSHAWRRVALALDRSNRLARCLCEWERTSVFLDTSKTPYQPRFLSQHREIRLKTIMLVRDGRATANSIMRKERLPFETAVEAWLWPCRIMNRTVRHNLRTGDVFWLRLEDLCRDPDGVLRSLHRFLGIEERALPGACDRGRFHIIGNTMRLSFDGSLRLDERWKSELSPEQRAYFERHAGGLNRYYGYRD
jgi:hypothetical protein